MSPKWESVQNATFSLAVAYNSYHFLLNSKKNNFLLNHKLNLACQLLFAKICKFYRHWMDWHLCLGHTKIKKSYSSLCTFTVNLDSHLAHAHFKSWSHLETKTSNEEWNKKVITWFSEGVPVHHYNPIPHACLLETCRFTIKWVMFSFGTHALYPHSFILKKKKISKFYWEWKFECSLIDWPTFDLLVLPMFRPANGEPVKLQSSFSEANPLQMGEEPISAQSTHQHIDQVCFTSLCLCQSI